MTKLVPRCAVSWSRWRRRFVESVPIKHFAASKFEIRSSKSEAKGKRSKSEFKNSKLETVWFGIFFQFEHLDLFRISEFEFRAWFYSPHCVRHQDRNVALTGHSFGTIKRLKTCGGQPWEN